MNMRNEINDDKLQKVVGGTGEGLHLDDEARAWLRRNLETLKQRKGAQTYSQIAGMLLKMYLNNESRDINLVQLKELIRDQLGIPCDDLD